MPKPTTKQQLSFERLLPLALVIGLLAGLGSVIFRWLVAFVHNFLFFGKFSHLYYEKFHTAASTWGMGVILVPVIAAPLVTWLIDRFAHEEKGLSVPEIMYNLRCKDGAVKPRIALVKTLTASISIGSGGSLGREGPVAQIGAAFASWVCDLFTLSREQRLMLVAAGAAASTAAIFNAPLAGMAFVAELMLVSVNAYSLTLLFVAVVSGTYIASVFFWSAPLFYIPSQALGSHFKSYLDLALFLPFGILLGLVSILLIRGVYWAEDGLSVLFKNDYLRHIVGMLLVGIMIYLFMVFYGKYYVEGIGFATIQDLLFRVIHDPCLLALLLVGKFLATCLTLGSGASGGIFSPSLFIGACAGALASWFCQSYFPGLELSPVYFVAAGMAGMLACSSGAVLTAILLAVETTRNYHLLWPILITVAAAYVMRIMVCKESIYTLKLLRRGVRL